MRPAGSERRARRRRFAFDELLPLLGLAGFGYALPLLDLLGHNPEFLVGHYLIGRSLVIAAVGIATLPPLIATASVVLARALSERAGHLVWAAWVVVFGALATGSLLRHVDLPSGPLTLIVMAIVVAAGGIGVLVALRRWRSARLAAGFLCLTPLVAVAALLLWSPASDLVWGADPGAIDGVHVENPAPVVMLQLDELPLASLLRADGSLNGDRFPNFARLAEQSTWFANAVAVAPSTTESVPAAVTGTVPEGGDLPTAADHPRNLFTLLGHSHELEVDEPVTALCPRSLCGGSVDWSGLAGDAVGVAGQLWLPARVRQRLPSDVQSLADFEDVDALGGDSALARQQRAEAGIDRIHGAGERPLLWYEHVVLPHVPWALTHSGAEYRTTEELSQGPTKDGDWGDDPTLARVGLQRHLLQVGAVDRLLGRLIDRLEHEGLWDDAFVVVLADHGAAFDPAEPYRRPTTPTVHEIYRIPLFVKVPGQTRGEARFDLAYNVDVLPTVLDVLGVTIDETAEEADVEALDGRSILEPVADRPTDAALYAADRGDAVHPDIVYAQVNDIARRNSRLLPYGDGWRGVAAGGPLGDRVGTPVADLASAGASDLRFELEQQADFSAVDTAASGALPAFVWGTMRGDDAPSDLLLALNGTVAGTLSRLAGGRYVGVVDEALIRQGHNEVQLLVPTADGTAFATLPTTNP